MAAQANIKAVITAEDRASGALKGFGNAVESMGGKLLNVAKKASLALGAAASASTIFAVKSAADFEQTRIGLENMLGSADKARAMLSKVSKFAAETPFEFPELAQATRQLVAFGFTGEKAFDTMTQLGDVSAAIGAPINDLAYLMGTLKAQGRAFMIDIRQFAQRGIPIYEYLAKVLKTDTEGVAALIEEGKIGFPEVQKAFKMMTAEGGKFHGTMAKQSKSLSGLFSTLKDVIGQTARELVGINNEGDVREGSLFDKLRKSTAWLIENLPALLSTIGRVGTGIIEQFKQWWSNIQAVAKQVGDHLLPKLEALWNTLSTKVLPVLIRLWKEVIVPLLPIIGGALVIAIGLVTDALNLMFSVLTPIINWILDNKWIVIALATAFGAVAGAMAFDKVVSSFKTSMATAIESIKLAKANAVSLAKFMTTTGAGAFGILAAAAVVAGALIVTAGNKAKKAWGDAQTAIDKASDSDISVIQQLTKLSKTGDAGQRERAKSQLKKLAESGNFASGGFTGRGGTNQVAGLVHKGEYVLPQSMVDQNSGTPKMGGAPINITIQAGAFMGSQVDARKYAMMIMDAYKDAMSMKGSNAVFAQ